MVLRALSEKLGITVDSQLCKDYAQAFNLSGDDALWKTLNDATCITKGQFGER